MNGLFITGTDTEIGKTFITALLTFGLRQQGIDICPVKPIASGGVKWRSRLVSEDALVYQRLAGVEEPPAALSPLCFRRPASPHLAAQLERKTIDPAVALDSLKELSQRHEFLLVEGIGGWLVPITYEYSVADFAQDLAMPVLLVSANRLGTINHTLLTLESIRRKGLQPAGVIMNYPGTIPDLDIAENNKESIQRIGGVDILGEIPYLGKNVDQNHNADSLWPLIKERFQWPTIIQLLHTQRNK